MYLVSSFVTDCSYPLGALHDASGNYHSGFYLAGSFMIVSGLLFLVLPCIEHIKKKTNDERDPLVEKKAVTALIKSTQGLHSALEWQLPFPWPSHPSSPY